MVLQIANKALLTDLIAFLNDKQPLNQLNHLKRIDTKHNNCRIIISPIEENCADNVQNAIDSLDLELKEFVQNYELENFHLCDVPACPPLTRNQFNQSSLLWPVNFHENK